MAHLLALRVDYSDLNDTEGEDIDYSCPATTASDTTFDASSKLSDSKGETKSSCCSIENYIDTDSETSQPCEVTEEVLCIENISKLPNETVADGSIAVIDTSTAFIDRNTTIVETNTTVSETRTTILKENKYTGVSVDFVCEPIPVLEILNSEKRELIEFESTVKREKNVKLESNVNLAEDKRPKAENTKGLETNILVEICEENGDHSVAPESFEKQQQAAEDSDTVSSKQPSSEYVEKLVATESIAIKGDTEEAVQGGNTDNPQPQLLVREKHGATSKTKVSK